MTFPALIDSVQSGGTLSTSHTISMPTFYAGSLVVALCTISGAVDGSGWPTGWTQLCYFDTSVDVARVQVQYWVATCAGQGSFNVTFGVGRVLACTVMSFEGWYGSVDATHGLTNSTSAQARSTTPNPPWLDLTTGGLWGSADNLWLACGGSANDLATVSSWDSNYTLIRQDNVQGNGTGVSQANAQVSGRNLAAGSEDPGSWTNADTAYWRAFTLAIQPGSAGYRKTSRLLKMGVR